jgi:hypothetical protein
VHTAIDVSSGTLAGFALGLAAFVFVRWATDKWSGEAARGSSADA